LIGPLLGMDDGCLLFPMSIECLDFCYLSVEQCDHMLHLFLSLGVTIAVLALTRLEIPD
jgi:hypothetical protein